MSKSKTVINSLPDNKSSNTTGFPVKSYLQTKKQPLQLSCRQSVVEWADRLLLKWYAQVRFSIKSNQRLQKIGINSFLA